MTDLYENVCSMLKANVDNEDEVKKLMENILNYGLQAGVISQLVYSNDIEEFIKANLSDIFSLLEEMLDEGVITEIPCDLSQLSWLVVEYVVANLYESVLY